MDILVGPENISDFEYVIVPGKVGYNTSSFLDYEKSYEYWKKTWKRIMTHLVGPEGFHPEDFQNFDLIGDIRYRGETIAQLCHRLLHLDLSVTLDLNYFTEFKGKALEDLRRSGVSRLMTMEYNSVSPKYSQRRTGFSFVQSSLYLGQELAKSLGVGCCTGVPRRVTGVQNQILEMNYKLVDQDLRRYGCPVDVMLGYVDDIVSLPPGLARDFYQELWRWRRVMAPDPIWGRILKSKSMEVSDGIGPEIGL